MKKAFDDDARSFDTLSCFGEGDSPDVFEGDISPNRDAEVGGFGTERDVRPGGVVEVDSDTRVARGGDRREETRLVFVDAEARNMGEGADEGEGGVNEGDADGGDGQVVGEGVAA